MKSKTIMNDFEILDKDGFTLCQGNLVSFYHHPIRINNVSIAMVTAGEAEIIINLTKHSIKKGTELFLLPGTIIEIRYKSDDFLLQTISFSPAIFHEASIRININEMHAVINISPYQHKLDDMDTFMIFASSIKRIYKESQHTYRKRIAVNYLQNYIFNLCYFAQKKLTNHPSFKFSNKDTIFRDFIILVKKNFKKHYTINYYAKELCISSRYLLRISQSVTGFSPKQIVDQILILETKMLLQSSTLSIQEIANDFHFPDQSTFGRFFRKHTGISPTAFRNGTPEKKTNNPPFKTKIQLLNDNY